MHAEPRQLRRAAEAFIVRLGAPQLARAMTGASKPLSGAMK